MEGAGDKQGSLMTYDFFDLFLSYIKAGFEDPSPCKFIFILYL